MTAREQRLDSARRWSSAWYRAMQVRAFLIADLLEGGADVSLHLARYVRARDHYVDAIDRCVANHEAAP